jgi:hypothetical protein
MPKIKNWSKVDNPKRGTKAKWTNDRDRSRISIVKISNITRGKDGWTVGTTIDKGDHLEPGPRENFDTLEDAEKWAKRWMKKNPNP